MKNEDHEIWKKAKQIHDAEGKILNALRGVTQNERRRILNYFWDRYVTNPDPSPKQKGQI